MRIIFAIALYLAVGFAGGFIVRDFVLKPPMYVVVGPGILAPISEKELREALSGARNSDSF
jgi:hypothetical protein